MSEEAILIGYVFILAIGFVVMLTIGGEE